MKKRKPYRTFTREFKLEAIRLMQESERPVAEIAREPLTPSPFFRP